MLPERLLDVEIDGGRVLPHYLTTRDLIWLEELNDRVRALTGRRRAEVEVALAWPPGWGERREAWRAMVQLILKWRGFRVRAPRPPRDIRTMLFEEAARASADEGRERILARAGRRLGMPASEIEATLYADVPSERVLEALATDGEAPASPTELVERYNLALAQGIVRRAERIRVRLQGNVRAVLRFARLQGLLCLASVADAAARDRDDHDDHDDTILEISGPLSLFRRTTKYGHALARWLPVLVRAPRWKLEAECAVRGRRAVWTASCWDPIGTTHVPVRRYDSKVEKWFVQDLRRARPDLSVLREADPVQIGRHIFCPDFTIVDSGRALRIPVEIVGFWTPAYLRHKVRCISGLPAGTRWLLCVDEQLDVGREASVIGPPRPAAATAADLPVSATAVLRYRRRIDIAKFLRFLERWLGESGSAAGRSGACTP